MPYLQQRSRWFPWEGLELECRPAEILPGQWEGSLAACPLHLCGHLVRLPHYSPLRIGQDMGKSHICQDLLWPKPVLSYQ